MVAAPRKVPAGLRARLGRPPCGWRDLRIRGTACKTIAVQHLPFREESGDHWEKTIPRGLASARGHRATGDFGTSGSLSLMALVHHRPQWMVGGRERRNGNARVHASRSGTGYESLFATRRFVSNGFSRSRGASEHRRWILFGRQHENEGVFWQSHAFGLSVNFRVKQC